MSAGLELFSTCPQSKDPHEVPYAERVAEIARWSERAGYRGMLVYTDNGLIDPWLVAQLALRATERLCPLVAVQPVYMHPYAVAKIVASIGHVYGRRVYLNMVAGGFRNDLISLGDETSHDERYARLTEDTQIVTQVLSGERVTFDGAYYTVRNVLLTPALPPELAPAVFVSGSSEAGMLAARTSNTTPPAAFIVDTRSVGCNASTTFNVLSPARPPRDGRVSLRRRASACRGGPQA